MRSSLKKVINNCQLEYNKHQDHVRELNDVLYNLNSERMSASEAINRVETYINTLTNTPKEFLKEIQEISICLKPFRNADELEDEYEKVAIYGKAIGMATFMALSNRIEIKGIGGNPSDSNTTITLTASDIANFTTSDIYNFKSRFSYFLFRVGSAFAVDILYTYTNKFKLNVRATRYLRKISEENECLRYKIKMMSIIVESTKSLRSAIDLTEAANLFPCDYNQFSSEQKQKLAAIVNATKALGEEINKKV